MISHKLRQDNEHHLFKRLLSRRAGTKRPLEEREVSPNNYICHKLKKEKRGCGDLPITVKYDISLRLSVCVQYTERVSAARGRRYRISSTLFNFSDVRGVKCDNKMCYDSRENE